MFMKVNEHKLYKTISFIIVILSESPNDKTALYFTIKVYRKKKKTSLNHNQSFLLFLLVMCFAHKGLSCTPGGELLVYLRYWPGQKFLSTPGVEILIYPQG